MWLFIFGSLEDPCDADLDVLTFGLEHLLVGKVLNGTSSCCRQFPQIIFGWQGRTGGWLRSGYPLNHQWHQIWFCWSSSGCVAFGWMENRALFNDGSLELVRLQKINARWITDTFTISNRNVGSSSHYRTCNREEPFQIVLKPCWQSSSHKAWILWQSVLNSTFFSFYCRVLHLNKVISDFSWDVSDPVSQCYRFKTLTLSIKLRQGLSRALSGF